VNRSKQPKVLSSSISRVIAHVVLALAGTAVVLSVAYFAVAELRKSVAPPEASPGALVDKAMSIPGAIVISPHRDLVEMGLATITGNPEGCDFSLTTGSPAIAVHTKKKWCVWELGYTYLLVHHGLKNCGGVSVVGNDNTFIGGGEHYKEGYEHLQKCVDEGNRPEPVNPKKYGAVCDGRHNDRPAIVKAIDRAARDGSYVALPDNCGIDPALITIPVGDICDERTQQNGIPYCSKFHHPIDHAAVR
jgi:hypothetical protein